MTDNIKNAGGLQAVLQISVSQSDIDAVKKMSRDDRDALKAHINATDPYSVFHDAGVNSNPDKRRIICPVCGNGSGRDHTPVEVSFIDGAWLYHCFCDCGFQGDLFKILADAHNLILSNFDDFCTALAIGAALTQNVIVTDVAKIPAVDLDARKENQIPLILADISDAQAHLPELPENQTRGLTFDTLRHFGCGYLPAWLHPAFRLPDYDGYKPSPSRRIIVPAGTHYNAVALPDDRRALKKKYWKMHAGAKSELFNSDALNSVDDTVLVVEGEFDAMSIWQAFEGKIAVVATLGVDGFNKLLLPAAKSHPDKNFLLLFDGDQTGIADAKKAVKTLRGLHLNAACKFFKDYISDADSKIDANDILQTCGSAKLKELLDVILADARADFYRHERIDKMDSTPPKSNAAVSDTDSAGAFEEKAALWQRYHGSIDPAVLADLRKAQAFLVDTTISAAIVYSTYTRHFLALCKAYDFVEQTAISFFARLADAKADAQKVIAKSKTEGADLVAPPDADISALANISIRDLKAAVSKDAALLANKHQKYQLALHAAQIKKAAKEKALADIAAQDNFRRETFNRLLTLAEQPRTDERDDAIIQALRDLCDWKHDKFGNPTDIKATVRNGDLIFTHDPNLDGLFAYDLFQQADVFLKAPPWNDRIKKGDEFKDRDEAQLQTYLRRNYHELVGRELIGQLVIDYSGRRSFHDVEDFFYNLPPWDGTKRAETLFVDFLRADNSDYVREVTFKWLLGAVARIFYPGCDFQYCPILHGEQKIGKSYLVKHLGKNWYGALADSVEDPHALDAIQKLWLVELKELRAVAKADVRAIKSFIDAQDDVRRAAYERRAARIKRHCVFIGTTNQDECLSDMTGNRRFPIIECHSARYQYVEGLTDDYVNQVWAEVFARFNLLFKDRFDEAELNLSRAAEKVVDELAEKHLRDDGLHGEVQAFLDTKIPPDVIWSLLTKDERRNFFTQNSVTLDFDDLKARFQSTRVTKQRQADFDAAVKPSELVLTLNGRDSRTGARDSIYRRFFGSRYRDHICAAEVFNEAFGNDRRKSMARISEVLKNLDGWAQGKRIQKEPAYGNQLNVYYRDPDNVPKDEPDADSVDAPVDEPDFDLSQFDD